MCKANVSAKKFFKLIFEILFYHIVINSIFLISGYTSFSLRSLLDFVVPFRTVDCNFIGTYMLFFLCMPFLNILINNLNEKQHVRLILLSTFIYVFFRTMPLFRVTMNYISWYIVLYFTASYIRLYPKQIFTKTKFWGISTGVCIVFCGLSVVLSAWISTKINRDVSYFFVMDANTLLAYLTGICSFMFFKNIKIKPSKLINTISSTTFGVLLIHANSDTMRIWLWKDTLKNVEMYSSDWVYLHAILSVTIIFIVCSIIELMRIRFIEKPFFVFFNKHYDKIAGKCLALENKLCEKFKIKD
ncbi:MAG: hypothetical protein UD936_11535 [Acutalibacteraceae bacterium]|nr:hypothetical protein [Acutalibacteraceae bacterium]